MNNVIEISGLMKSDFEFAFEKYGERFYTAQLECKRISGKLDTITIMVSDRNTFIKDLSGECVFIEGNIRTHNITDENNCVHLQLVVFVNNLTVIELYDIDNRIDLNSVHLEGFTCKDISARETPKGKRLADAIIAVNRPFSHNDYIPCIFWNDNSLIVADCDIGDGITIDGRLQSRDYNKRTPSGLEHKTTYEVSVQEMKVV